MPRPGGRPIGPGGTLAVERSRSTAAGNAGVGRGNLAATRKPAVAEKGGPREISFLDEARAAGVDVPSKPHDAEGNVYRCTYRGRPLDLLVRQRGVMYGVKIATGTRRYHGFTLPLALEAIEDELAGRPVDQVETLQTQPGPRTLFPASRAGAPDPAAESGGVDVGASRPGAVAESRVQAEAVVDRPPPEPAALPGSPKRDPAPPPMAARPRGGEEPQLFIVRDPIPRVGGPIMSGTLLELVAEHPPREIVTPEGHSGWRNELTGRRGNLRSVLRGRTVCDYPLDQLEEVIG